MLQWITFGSICLQKVDAGARKDQSWQVRKADRQTAIFATGRQSARRRRPANEALPDTMCNGQKERGMTPPDSPIWLYAE
ncbi:hypothetical protein ASD50_20135 [Mesorhizobium sp. Root552]|nr:hypothetical protein ASD50_20135 [Mesorhizobium sp. Root552]